jgi:tRNA(fMet)-specific endonuclease VapC
MILVLDTSVVSALMRREAGAFGRLKKLRPGDLILCSPVAAEIRFGLERLPDSRRRSLLEGEYSRLRAVLPWSDWTEQASLEFGRQKAHLERAGTPVGDMDVVIASVALSVGGGVATTNARDFRRMSELPVEDWGGT